MIWLLRLVSAGLYSLAGFGVFLTLFGRALIYLPHGFIRHTVTLLVGALLTGGGALAGWALAEPAWFYAPVAIISALAAGELRRAWDRRRYGGSQPLDTRLHAVQLTAPVTTTDLVIHRFRVQRPEWQGRPLRVALLSDLHVNPHLPLAYYRRVLDSAEQARPDLAFFTGDFVTDVDSLPLLREALRPIGRLGSFAVLGNHDHWAGPQAVAAVVQESGLRLLENETITLDVEGRPVAISGTDYPWASERPYQPQLPQGILHLMLSHTPDNIYRIAAASGGLVFSGHYHAGQFRLPGLGPLLIPSRHGRRFERGHYRVGSADLFVSAGVGAARPPLRIYCRPDLLIIDICSKEISHG